ncbi:MAG: hypothetical protein HKN61_06050 [Flavobacteriaceae bacterium]|nr:hypothetical protein [Flavobacteriaceae bacterium]
MIRLFGIAMLLAGLSLLILPDFLMDWISRHKQNTWLYSMAIVVRVVFGILFLIVAKQSRSPLIFQMFGFIFILGAIFLLFTGQDNFQHFISSMIPELQPYARVSGLLALIFGGFLLYALPGNKAFKKF